MPTLTETPVIGGVFRRVKATMQRPLEAAMAEVTELEAARVDIRNRFDQELANETMTPDGVFPMRFAKTRGYLLGREWQEFARQYPTWRETLKRAAEIKLALVTSEHEKILKAVRRQLGAEFSEDDLIEDIRVKRARRGVEYWRGLLQQIETRKDDEALWGRVTPELLVCAETGT